MQNLASAYLGADGQVHIASREGVNHLQNLAWLGDDGQVHTVNQQNNGQQLLGAGNPFSL